MKKIQKLEELIPDEYYWLCSKMIYDNGTKSNSMMIHQYRDHKDGTPAYFGSGRIWAHEGNNQAMENYDIYGPIPRPEIKPDIEEELSLIEKIKKDNLAARKIHDKERSKILTLLISEISMIGKNDGNRETTDQEALKVIEKAKNNALETMSFMDKSGASEKELESYAAEIAIYDDYLPQKMSDEELTSLIKDIIDHDSNANIGVIMKYLKNHHNGLYDGKKANEIIRKILPN